MLPAASLVWKQEQTSRTVGRTAPRLLTHQQSQARVGPDRKSRLHLPALAPSRTGAPKGPKSFTLLTFPAAPRSQGLHPPGAPPGHLPSTSQAAGHTRQLQRQSSFVKPRDPKVQVRSASCHSHSTAHQPGPHPINKQQLAAAAPREEPRPTEPRSRAGPK